jgi:hypothetical protein
MGPDLTLPLTLDEHRELGAEIKAASARFRELEHLVVSVYGPVNSASISFGRVVEALERLQREMEAQAATDVPSHRTYDLYR